MSFCSFQPMDLCSSIYQVPDHSFLPYNHTSSVLIHLDIRSRYTYTYTPFWLHSLTLLVRLLDHHSSLLLLGNLGFLKMGNGFRVSIRKDSNDFLLLSLKFLLVVLRCNLVLRYHNCLYSCSYSYI